MRASGLLLGVLLFVSVASAQEGEPPSMELLEFLGEWGDADPALFAQELDGATALAGNADENPRAKLKEESKDDD